MAAVAIFGAGETGGAVAQALAARDCVRRIVLVDPAASVAAGKALDIQQSGAVDGFHTILTGTDDISAVTGVSICIVADRQGAPSQEWNGEDGLALLRRLLPISSGVPIIFAGAGSAGLMARCAAELKAPRRSLVGSSPEAFAAALRALVALDAPCTANDVSLAVLGVPPDSFVVPWSEASIRGYALDRVLSQAQLARLETRAARLWPPGPYALGAAAARTAEAMIRSARGPINALAVLDGDFGARNQVGAVPVFLSPEGIARVCIPDLNPRERVRVESALGG